MGWWSWGTLKRNENCLEGTIRYTLPNVFEAHWMLICNKTIKIHVNFEWESVKLLPFSSVVSKAELPLNKDSVPLKKSIWRQSKMFPSSVKIVHKTHSWNESIVVIHLKMLCWTSWKYRTNNNCNHSSMRRDGMSEIFICSWNSTENY